MTNQSILLTVLDFSKAFDKVPHEGLLSKLPYYGIRGPLLNWSESFLTNRTHHSSSLDELEIKNYDSTKPFI